ncbi:MAG: PfaD family polyunsaturated fatty acid/polyketide biosynthesis protein [Nitrospinae bacterium]|nr:PfaD family polyunsaturated fatty acid/polyketide biosynthesis protein [Nitrospinota bacterium]
MGELISNISQPLYIVVVNGKLAASNEGTLSLGDGAKLEGSYPAQAYLPPIRLEKMGDAAFCRDVGIRYPYIVGGMANGITSVEIVEEMGNNGMLAFFGTAGLSLKNVKEKVAHISSLMGGKPYGFNLIHSPNEQDLEAALVEEYLKSGVRLVEAAAYINLTLPLVRYRITGLRRDGHGKVVTPNRVIAKVSRVEVASKFFAPPPKDMVAQLLAKGEISEEEAALAAEIPMAQDITAEADSGGHTDNRPALALIPTIISFRDRMQSEYGFEQRLRVGGGGGIGSPEAVAAMFAMGAAYIVTGSINQSCVESGTSDTVRKMLEETGQADVTMAPAADMFEMGGKVQVLKRGTMFAMRGEKLRQLYLNYKGLDSLPKTERDMLENKIFSAPLEDIWADTRAFFMKRDPSQVERGEMDEKHKMALVFRWYLGQSSGWAISGDPKRKIDYQIWCGPSMGSFNEWAKGSFLERYENRKVVTLALNLLHGGALAIRQADLRRQGVSLPEGLSAVRPKSIEQIKGYID